MLFIIVQPKKNLPMRTNYFFSHLFQLCNDSISLKTSIKHVDSAEAETQLTVKDRFHLVENDIYRIIQILKHWVVLAHLKPTEKPQHLEKLLLISRIELYFFNKRLTTLFC